jgi:hypothetical protein
VVYGVGMQTPTRRHRGSSTPVRSQRTISPYDIDERYIEVLKLLEPYYNLKYLTIPWLHYLSKVPVEYSVFRKYLGYLRQSPNNYIVCPEKQNASPNVDRKTLVYELAERGLNELIRRGLVPKRHSSNAAERPLKATRNFSFALHRSNSYYHEIIVDLGYHAPLHHFVRSDPNLRLVDFARLTQHRNVPQQTREAKDPLLIQLKDTQLRFDGTPHLLIRKGTDGVALPLGIPGIQVDRGTESFQQLAKHLLHAIEFIEDRHFARHWGFDNCLIPFLFTNESRKIRAMEFVRQERGRCAFLLFQTIPDIGLLRHFPRPEHYAPDYQYIEGEPVHPSNIRIFTNPWQRVGYADFYLSTFSENPSN